MRIHPIIAIIIAFSFISMKEVVDMLTYNFIEFDDVALNMAGACFGSTV